MPYLSPVGNEQQNDSNGAPLAGGLVYTYQAGTTTPQATYTDSTGGTAQTNPIVLNASGLPNSPIWLPNGQAVKLVIQNAAGVTQRTVDSVTGINDPAAASNVSEWVSYTGTPTYISATSFSVAGDQTGTLQVNRRVKTTNSGGTRYGTITGSAFSAGLTTVSVLLDSGSLDSGLSAVSYGLLAASNPSAPSFSYSTSPYRNVVINGHMLADQRNAGAAQTFTAAAALAYCVDRWYGYCTGANVTGQQITASDGTKRYRFTGAASNTAIGFAQRIEAANSVHLAGNVCTLSVKLANSLLTTVNWAAYYANSADSFGTLASPTRTAIASGSFTVTSAEATYSAQISVPAAATTGIEIVFTVGAQISGTWQIGDVMLERGAIPNGAIVFERPETGENLRRCQRYYYKSVSAATSGYNNAGATVYADAKFPCDMRAVPTMTLSSFSNSNASNATAGTTTPQFCRLQTNITATGAGFSICTAEASAEL